MLTLCTRAKLLRLALLAAVFTAVALFSLTSQSQSEDAPRTREAFERAFTEAFGSGLVELTMPLFYWEGVPNRSRAIIISLIQRDLSRRLQSLTWLPPETSCSTVGLP